jgi:hypothetical protein
MTAGWAAPPRGSPRAASGRGTAPSQFYIQARTGSDNIGRQEGKAALLLEEQAGIG